MQCRCAKSGMNILDRIPEYNQKKNRGAADGSSFFLFLTNKYDAEDVRNIIRKRYGKYTDTYTKGGIRGLVPLTSCTLWHKVRNLQKTVRFFPYLFRMNYP